MSTPTATLPYALFGSRLRLDALGHLPRGLQAKIMGCNLSRPVTV
jgi:hypothetical protein